MWIVYALLSAFFAALTSILAKAGMKSVDSNLATAIRTAVVMIMAWGIVFLTGRLREIPAIQGKTLLFLVLSGLATGLSWLFYFRALQIGEASKVIPIDKLSVVFGIVMAFVFLGEPAKANTIIGGLVITAGAVILIL